MHMSIKEGTQVSVFDRNTIPKPHQEAQMVEGLKSAWTLPNSTDVIYAHPDRFSEGALRSMFVRGEAEAVLLHNDESVLGWLALVHHDTIGNTEIGSVNAKSGHGTGLVEETYREAEVRAMDNPFMFFDTATCRTGMERAAKAAAKSTGLRVVVPTYVDPNVWGDKERGIDWGCIGYFAISTSYLSEKGPLSLPQLPNDKRIADGTEEIISDVISVGNMEGEVHEMTVFGDREERLVSEPRPMRILTEGLVSVDYMDTEARKALLDDGHKPCGIELGMIDGKVTMDIHYSPLEVRESSFGKNGELTMESHPVRTDVATTAALTELIRSRRTSRIEAVA